MIISELIHLLDTNPLGIQVLKAIRNEDRIIDFEYILANSAAKEYLSTEIDNKTFLDVTKNSFALEKLIVMETGAAVYRTEMLPLKAGTRRCDIKYVKLDDDMLLMYHDKIDNTAGYIIAEADHFVKGIAETTPDIIYIMNLDTYQLLYHNRQIGLELGYSKPEIDEMANPLFDLMVGEDIPRMIEHLEKIKSLKDGEVAEIEYRLVNSEDKINWFIDRNCVFKRNIFGVPVEKIGICRNITARKEQEDIINTSISILNQAEEIAGIGSWEYDILTGDFKWSDGMYRLFNVSKDIFITPEIYFAYTPENERPVVNELVNNITRKNTAFETSITLLPPQQDPKVVRIRTVMVRDKNKRPVKMVGVDLDITRQIEAADRIFELNKGMMTRNIALETLNSELRSFNSVITIDYKETIQTLYTNLEYIITKEAFRLSDTAKANIRRSQSSIQKMKLLTDDITRYLQLYDIGINKSIIDPNSILLDILSGMKHKIEQAEATVDMAHFSPLSADPLLLSWLISNLLDNALKFRRLVVPMVVKIRYSIADEMNIIKGAHPNTAYYMLSVSDNGIGFDDKDSEKIFELFFRLHDKTHYRGSGIGLAICKKIMDMHDGFIIAEGIAGSGATFTCYFPLV